MLALFFNSKSMKITSIAPHVLAIASIALYACTPPPGSDTDTTNSSSSSVSISSSTSSVASSEASVMSSSSSVPDIVETAAVEYTGIVRSAGISIYMEGTHRLILEDGSFVLLESSSADLNGYVGENARVYGSVRPTVEDGAVIMRVDTISLVEISSSSESSSSSVAESSSSSSSLASSASSISSSDSSSSVSSVAITVDMQVAIDAMSDDNVAASQWTQEYCTSHIGFCLPIHKQWWYRSFGATTTSLWHVEMSAVDFTNLGEGPIVVRLLSGTVASKNAVDGQVRQEEAGVVGYKEWTENRHFEVRAPIELQAHVGYIVGAIYEMSDE